MGNMFDNLGKGLNDFTKQAGKIAGNIGDTAGKITKDVAKGAGKIANDAGKLAGDAGKMTAAVAGSVAQSAAVASGEVSKAADSMAKGTVSIAKNVKDSADKVDLFNSKLRAKAVEDYNNAVERYENVADDLAKSTQALYDLRKIAIVHVKYVEQHINQLANTPKEFAVELHKINTEVTTFENKEDEIKEAEKQAKAAEGGSGAGATLSALGIAVATMGPTAAMGVATTFGVASTGTAISALSGAAANSAALAWLGLVAVHWLQVAVACQPEPRSWAWLVRLDGPSLAWRALRQLVLVFMRIIKTKKLLTSFCLSARMWKY